MIDEILISAQAQEWEQIKSGAKTIVIQKKKPMLIGMPFRVFVYTPAGGVGCFDCNMIMQAMPDRFVDGSCLTEEELQAYAAGNPLFGWYVKEGSVVEYEAPIALEMVTGNTNPPEAWQYLRRLSECRKTN